MSDPDRQPMLWSIPGNGVLAREESLVLLSSIDDRGFVESLLGLLARASSAGGDGRAFTDALEAEVQGDQTWGSLPADPGPAVLGFGPAGAGLAIMVSGTAWAEVTTALGTHRLVAGQPSIVLRGIVGVPVRAVRGGLVSGTGPADRTDRFSRLDRGTMRASGLSYSTGEPARAPLAAPPAPPPPVTPPPVTPPAVTPQPVTPPAVTPQAVTPQPVTPPAPPQASAAQPAGPQWPPAPVPAEPGPAEPGPAAPVPAAPAPAEPVPAAPVPAAPAPAAPAPAEPSPAAPVPAAPAPAEPESPADNRTGAAASQPPDDEPAGPGTSPAAGGGTAPGAAGSSDLEPEPLAYAPPPAPPTSYGPATGPDRPSAASAASDAATRQEEGAPIILGVYCKNGHFGAPDARSCAVCGAGISRRSATPQPGPRPPLGVLVLDDGATVEVDGDYVIGRDPARDPSVSAGDARGLRIVDAESTVSRVHARLHLEGWRVLLTDLGSANGTRIRPPGAKAEQALDPEVAVPLQYGTRVFVGEQGLRYEPVPWLDRRK